MRAAEHPLWHRLQTLEVHDPVTHDKFLERLRLEQGWSRGYVERVWQEYERFLFLTCVAGHAVCPSDGVDQAWHQHLTFTRSYWQDLCENILGRRLHHDPSRGGSCELAKHVHMYEQTLEAYRHWFGAAPPTEIWPDAAQRFSGEDRFQRVDRARYWVLPKQTWLRSKHRWLIGGLSGVGGIGGACLAWMPPATPIWNPWTWMGPDFLVLYLVVLVLGVMLAFWLQKQMLAPELDYSGKLTELETAYLAGGPARCLQTAIVILIGRGHLKYQEHKKSWWQKIVRIQAALPLPPQLAPSRR